MAYYGDDVAAEEVSEYSAKLAYSQANALSGQIGVIRNTKRKRLEDQKAGLEKALAKINAALDALNAHPELEQFLNILEAAEKM